MSRTSYSLCLLSLLLFVIAPRPECAARADGPATRRIEQALRKHSVPDARVGIAVRRLSDGAEFFTRSPRDLFELASNAKLFTTAVALRELGAEYEFKTALIANGPIEDGRLVGDLVVVGGGDPSLSGRFHGGDAMAVPERMARAVREAGITETTGDLVLDDRLFDRELRAPGWPADEALWWYAAPVCALSFNDNCLDIRITGARRAGAPAIVAVAPDVDFGRVVNRTFTCAARNEEGIAFAREADGTLAITGKIRSGIVRAENIAVEQPALYLGAAVRRALAQEGVVVRGATRLVREGEQARPEAREIFAWRSRLADAVAVANRRSQNFYAEQIFKTLGATKFGVGSFRSGAKAVRDHLVAAGFPAGTVLPADGCGLSPGNRATPQAVVALLETMYNSPLREIYMGSLAANGDAVGTLRHRLTEPAALRRIHAKTGTIRTRGISALSGYAKASDGRTYAFAILTNDYPPVRFSAVRAMEDAVCRALLGVPDK